MGWDTLQCVMYGIDVKSRWHVTIINNLNLEPIIKLGPDYDEISWTAQQYHTSNN